MGDRFEDEEGGIEDFSDEELLEELRERGMWPNALTDDEMAEELRCRGKEAPWLRWYELLSIGKDAGVMEELRQRVQDETGRVLPG